jgi:Protein of unknown function (DUF3606)
MATAAAPRGGRWAGLNATKQQSGKESCEALTGSCRFADSRSGLTAQRQPLRSSNGLSDSRVGRTGKRTSTSQASSRVERARKVRPSNAIESGIPGQKSDRFLNFDAVDSIPKSICVKRGRIAARATAAVNLSDESEVRWWCKELGCTRRRLFAAIQAVGPMVMHVKRYLEKCGVR